MGDIVFNYSGIRLFRFEILDFLLTRFFTLGNVLVTPKSDNKIKQSFFTLILWSWILKEHNELETSPKKS